MSQKVIPVTAEHNPDTDVACREIDKQERSLLGKVIDRFADHCRARSLFILHYCTGCGAIELPPTITSRFDSERLGIQPMVTPRQADILLITGYLSTKTLKRVILTYEQMQGPKYVIGMGSCTINGGMYWNSYATVKRLQEYLPVDLYIAGCMPRPEAIQQGFLQLIKQIDRGEGNAWQDYYRRYDQYLGNQQALFGPDWHTPTDVIAEAKHYNMLGEHTEGEHTALLEKFASAYVTNAKTNTALQYQE
ncbi:NADH-quinone oxidoreductase subunit B [Candidatus Venteria ishoeyi]|uniref:NAD(P)H-quinone oxidoreductase subunit K n=1 Tax=Candidatus Venteria ishoeyi TaxID=1899563 RepID=A0A1H6F7C8_9GAMM|nr:NADH-quinone oxidoreductase subunit NuoB [Candidatus Venteria ishoeyi]MDM8546626.1 NADH-quinone oxidoreductase subunit NuoB [Candidatus Venteria ishoeyi]SEH06037.1 NAD(P)H-quinone oxidoreductase subunit K [Candidatus Venteria ishoeyi]